MTEDLRVDERPATRSWPRRLAIATGVVVLLIAGTYVWARLSLDSSPVARAIVWLGADVDDWQRFPARTVPAGDTPLLLATPEDPHPAVAGLDIDGTPLHDLLVDTGTTAFLVARGELLLHEEYLNGSSREATQTSFSTAKSFGSTLVGIAQHEGLLRLDDPITDHLPELADKDPRYADITIRNLITMSSGLRYSEKGIPWSDDATTYYAPDLRAAAFSTPVVRPPGEEFLYNNYNPLLVGMILERVTGMHVAEYLAARLWQPMGAEADGSWSLDSEASGFEKMESGINGRAVDFLKLGIVFAQEGRIADRQVVPAVWVDEATRADTTTDPAEEYQYFWWVFPEYHAFSAIGNHGQFIYVDPATDVVVVRMGRTYGSLGPFEWIDVLADVAAAVEAAGS